MNNQVQAFTFGNQEVRGLLIEGEPWLVGKDIAQALGYKDTTNALKAHVDEGDKTGWRITTQFGEKVTIIINESGFYSLVLSSKLPTAQEFKHWVTSEVLPSIRKTGSYSIRQNEMLEDSTQQLTQQIIADPDFGIKLLTALKEERERNETQRKRIEEMEPKEAYHDNVLACQNVVSISVIAKDYGKSARWLNEHLHEKGVQYKQGKTWVLYAKYAECGYTATRTHTPLGKDGDPLAISHTYWTQKGRRFIYDLLKEDGILPAYEREELA